MRAAVVDRWRFDRKVVWSPTCLWWVGAIGDDGYGRFATGTGRVSSAHRWLWEQDVGPLRGSLSRGAISVVSGCGGGARLGARGLVARVWPSARGKRRGHCLRRRAGSVWATDRAMASGPGRA